jgi:hypothetical protein
MPGGLIRRISPSTVRVDAVTPAFGSNRQVYSGTSARTQSVTCPLNPRLGPMGHRRQVQLTIQDPEGRSIGHACLAVTTSARGRRAGARTARHAGPPPKSPLVDPECAARREAVQGLAAGGILRRAVQMICKTSRSPWGPGASFKPRVRVPLARWTPLVLPSASEDGSTRRAGPAGPAGPGCIPIPRRTDSRRWGASIPRSPTRISRVMGQRARRSCRTADVAWWSTNMLTSLAHRSARKPYRCARRADAPGEHGFKAGGRPAGLRDAESLRSAGGNRRDDAR